MNKQEAIYRMFASRAAVLQNNSMPQKNERWFFEQTDKDSLLRAVEPSGKVHIVSMHDVGSVALGKLLQSMARDLGGVKP